MVNCKACEKVFSEEITLDNHFKRSPLCHEWFSLLDSSKYDLKNKQIDEFDYTLINKIQTVFEIKDIPSLTEYSCKSCHKTFSNLGNLNKHINRNIICQKWDKYHSIQERKPMSHIKGYNNNSNLSEIMKIKEEPSLKNDDEFFGKQKNGVYNIYSPAPEPVDNKIMHIIWNVLLSDKDAKLTEQDFKQNKITYVIALLPFIEDYNNLNLPECEYTVMEYKHDHTTNINIEQYIENCKKIENIRKTRTNVLIFCNNGYQRSIPFLCYYLMKFHNDEVPDLDKALDIILPQVDKENYSKNKKMYLESIPNILHC